MDSYLPVKKMSVNEHRTGNREVTGSNPVEVLNFFSLPWKNDSY